MTGNSKLMHVTKFSHHGRIPPQPTGQTMSKSLHQKLVLPKKNPSLPDIFFLPTKVLDPPPFPYCYLKWNIKS